MLVLGIACAAVAALMYDFAVALQAREAREISLEHGLRLSLYGRLLRNRAWIVATLVSIAGFPLQVVALLWAPLTVVQPTLAVGLLLLLALGSRMLGERVGVREILGVGLVVGGVAGLAIVAPEHSTHDTSAKTIVLILTGLAIVGAVPYLRRAWSASLPVVYAAGLWFAWGGITSKFLADDLFSHHWAPAAGWAAVTGLAGAVALLAEMTALQSRPAVQVAPIVFVVQVAVPVLLAPVLAGETWSGTPGGGVLVVVLLAVVAGGSVVLGRSRAVLGMHAAAREREEASAAGADELPDRDGGEAGAAQRGEHATDLGPPAGAGADLEHDAGV